MVSDIGADNLIGSSQWRQFMESTANAMQINLVFVVAKTGRSISVGEKCYVCSDTLPPICLPDSLSELDAYLNNLTRTDVNESLETFGLQSKFLVIARRSNCCNDDAILSFHNRVCIAKELLNNFLTILLEQWNGEQLYTELSALRQINHIVLSMFRREHRALERALDLILSAAIILFDARGSFLEYRTDNNTRLLKKGCCEAPCTAQGQGADDSISAEINSPAVSGRLGIQAPVEMERAVSFLHFMVQECIIAFEIDNLMNLMETRMTAVLGVVESLVLLIDKRMKICYANKIAEKLLSRPAQELLGLPAADITAPWNECLVGSGKAARGIKDPLGNRYVNWSVYALSGADVVPAWLVIADDCTDIYRWQEIGEQAERMASTTALFGVLAHELRNPLATFRGLLQLIRTKGESEDFSKYIDLGLKEVDRVTYLLNDYLLMGKPAEVSHKPIDLKFFLQGMLPLLNGEINGTSVQIKTSFSAVSPVQVDAAQLTQVMINLVRNAYEALNQQGYIYISVGESKNGWVEITVRDTGPGISAAVRDRLFQPFFTTKAGGTGLGLAISQTIIRNHGGDISAQNHPEGGASFSVILPTKTYMNRELDKTDVIMVTNDDMLRLPTEQVLRAENIDIISVDSIGNALFMLNRCFCSILIIDNAMNLLDCEKIILKFPNVKILIAGGDDNLKARQDIYCIPKPLNYAKLIGRIKSLMNEEKSAHRI